MAQIANGCRLQWCRSHMPGEKLEDAGMLDWRDVEDATNIPALTGTTAAVETTRIIDKAKTYTPGIADNGGNLDFTCHWTRALLSTASFILDEQKHSEIGFRVIMEEPANCQLFFKGKIAPIANEAIESEGILSGILSVYPSTKVEIVPNEEIAGDDPHASGGGMWHGNPFQWFMANANRPFPETLAGKAATLDTPDDDK